METQGTSASPVLHSVIVAPETLLNLGVQGVEVHSPRCDDELSGLQAQKRSEMEVLERLGCLKC
jgi:hypothetical protein